MVNMRKEDELKQLCNQEYNKYLIEKKQFYNDPLHWNNNKRKRHGLHTLRGSVNKYRVKQFYKFQNPIIFALLEDIIEETLPKTMTE